MTKHIVNMIKGFILMDTIKIGLRIKNIENLQLKSIMCTPEKSNHKKDIFILLLNVRVC